MTIKEEMIDKALRGDFVAQGETAEGVIYSVVQDDKGYFYLLTERMDDVRMEELTDDRVMNVVGMVGTLSVMNEV